MTKRKTTKEAEAKAEMIYWATGRTKIYPEKNFAKNYAEIKARSEKKREASFKHRPTNVVPKEQPELRLEEDTQPTDAPTEKEARRDNIAPKAEPQQVQKKGFWNWLKGY